MEIEITNIDLYIFFSGIMVQIAWDNSVKITNPSIICQILYGYVHFVTDSIYEVKLIQNETARINPGSFLRSSIDSSMRSNLSNQLLDLNIPIHCHTSLVF